MDLLQASRNWLMRPIEDDGVSVVDLALATGVVLASAYLWTRVMKLITR